jgi:hypothetical protein
MKSVQEYIKVLEDIESSATEQGGNVKGPFTAGQLAQIFSKLPPIRLSQPETLKFFFK